jgi:hypothetical protein
MKFRAELVARTRNQPRGKLFNVYGIDYLHNDDIDVVSEVSRRAQVSGST